MTGPQPAPRILVTGASSGIGAAIARRHAAPGATLVLWGRDTARLETTRRACAAAGARVVLRRLDLADLEAGLAAAADDDQVHSFTHAYLCAGIGDIAASDVGIETPHAALAVAQLNFSATVGLATALGGAMAGRGAGVLVVLGSAAAFHALPFAPSYVGSKAGLARFTEALGLALRRHRVRVMLVSPGFVDTPMSRRLDCPKPLLMTPDAAAARIVRAASSGRTHLVLPRAFVWLRWLDRAAPAPLRRAVLARLSARQTPWSA